MFLMDTYVFYQASLFGVVTVLIGLLLSITLSSLKPELPTACEEWDKYYVMEFVLFFTGFLLRCLLINDMSRSYLYNF